MYNTVSTKSALKHSLESIYPTSFFTPYFPKIGLNIIPPSTYVSSKCLVLEWFSHQNSNLVFVPVQLHLMVTAISQISMYRSQSFSLCSTLDLSIPSAILIHMFLHTHFISSIIPLL